MGKNNAASGVEGNERNVPRSTAFTFRLPREELAALEQAASQAGLSVSEYLRKSAAFRPATSVLARPQANISVGTPYSQYSTSVVWSESQACVTEFQATGQGVILC